MISWKISWFIYSIESPAKSKSSDNPEINGDDWHAEEDESTEKEDDDEVEEANLILEELTEPQAPALGNRILKTLNVCHLSVSF